VGAAGTGVGENTVVGIGEMDPGIFCGFGDELIDVPGNLKGPSVLQQHDLRALPRQQQHALL